MSANNNKIQGCHEPGQAQGRRELGSLRWIRPLTITDNLSFMRVRGAGSRTPIMQWIGGGWAICARLQIGHEFNRVRTSHS
jgi:hypothetical protein